MRTPPCSSVREHQRLVLASLHLARRPVTPVQIASHLNTLREHTGLPETSAIEIEASLAALMLRPELRGLIACTTRSASKRERRQRSRARLGALATVVILSACATVHPSLPDPGSTLPNYFGGTNFVAKEMTRSSRPVFAGSPYVTAHEVPLLALSDIVHVSAKAQASDPGAVSYFADEFNDESSSRFSARAEADVASPEMFSSSAGGVVLSDPRPSIGTSSFASAVTAARPHGLSQFPSFATSDFQATQLLPPLVLSLASTSEVFGVVTVHSPPESNSNVPSAALDSTKLSPAPTTLPLHQSITPKPFGAVPALPTGIYDDLVTFSNCSLVLSPQAQTRVLAMIEAAKIADSVQLRGRVGNRFLTPQMSRQAIGRAVAVRELLVRNGVPRDKVRIQIPRNNDLVNPGSPMDESNRSVTVLMKLAPTVADGLGLRPGLHISAPKTLLPASA